MKSIKVALLILLFFSIFLLFIFIFRYAFWQDISLTDYGTFKIPKNWIVTQKQDIIYITDKPIQEEGYKIYLVGVRRIKSNDGKYRYEHFENVERLGYGWGAITSYSAEYFLEIYNINGVIEEKYVISFSNSGQPTIYFLAWDNLLNRNEIIKIAKSYKTYPPVK